MSEASEARPEGAVTCRYCRKPIEPEHLMAAVLDNQGSEARYFHGSDQNVYRSWECEQQAQVLGFHNSRKRIVFFGPIQREAA